MGFNQLNVVPLTHLLSFSLPHLHSALFYDILGTNGMSLIYVSLWQVVRGLLALNNEQAVQIDSHDTLWGETGMFLSIILHHTAPVFIVARWFVILDLGAVIVSCSGRAFTADGAQCVCLCKIHSMFSCARC